MRFVSGADEKKIFDVTLRSMRSPLALNNHVSPSCSSMSLSLRLMIASSRASATTLRCNRLVNFRPGFFGRRGIIPLKVRHRKAASAFDWRLWHVGRNRRSVTILAFFLDQRPVQPLWQGSSDHRRAGFVEATRRRLLATPLDSDDV